MAADIALARQALYDAIEATHSNGRMSNDEIEGVVQRLLRLGGAVFDTFATTEVRQRPWNWLLATTESAATAGDHLCVIYSAFWVHTWRHEFFPRFGPYEWTTYGTDQVPDGICAAIKPLALAALNHLPDDQVLFGDESGAIKVGWMRDSLDILLPT